MLGSGLGNEACEERIGAGDEGDRVLGVINHKRAVGLVEGCQRLGPSLLRKKSLLKESLLLRSSRFGLCSSSSSSSNALPLGFSFGI